MSQDLDELKAIIKCIHAQWYSGDFLTSKVDAAKMCEHMEYLWNFAGIEDTLVENNPDGVTREQFLAHIFGEQL